MLIEENIELTGFNTLQLSGRARFFARVKNEDDVRSAIAFAKSRHLPVSIWGGGSNLLISNQVFPGLIIKNEIKGLKFSDASPDRTVFEVGSGEMLDEVIQLAITRKLGGSENLSGIPGTVGGAVVQNAGAYGLEMKDVLSSVEGIRMDNGKRFSFSVADCRFGYRESIFKRNKNFFITAVFLSLDKNHLPQIDYTGLREKVETKGRTDPSSIREAVLDIRGQKLPDWHLVGTAGSFYKNPIISAEDFSALKEKYPELPGFPEKGDRIKVSLAWILDKICGLKNYCEGRVCLYEKQPLVLTNLGGATASEVTEFSKKIKKIVKEKTGLEIEEEVEMIK